MQRLQSSARMESLSEVAQTEGSFPQTGVIGSRACIDDRFEEPRFFPCPQPHGTETGAKAGLPSAAQRSASLRGDLNFTSRGELRKLTLTPASILACLSRDSNGVT